MEFDHLFICVEKPATEAALLIDFGLTEGAPNHHPGQGTANRRFFFHNGFIELLFATDHGELSSELTEPTKLRERFPQKANEVSPFGICFRPSEEKRAVQFDTWSYRPQFLPEHLEVKVAPSLISEPMWFYLSFGSRPDWASEEKLEPLNHECGFKEITSIKVYAPAFEVASEPSMIISKSSIVECVEGKEHLMEIAFDNETQGLERDFRPFLPLKFSW